MFIFLIKKLMAEFNERFNEKWSINIKIFKYLVLSNQQPPTLTILFKTERRSKEDGGQSTCTLFKPMFKEFFS